MAEVTLRRSTLFPVLAVMACGLMWGVFWLPMRWLEDQGVGGAWVSVVFNIVALVAPLPWLMRREAWRGFRSQAVTGALLGAGFSLYTIALVTTDVIHAILLFYLTPVWGTLCGWIVLGERLGAARLVSIALGFLGIGLILGAGAGLPMPQTAGDWAALASGLLWAAGSLRSYARPSASIALPVFCFAAGGLVSAVAILAVAQVVAPELAAPAQVLAHLPMMIALALIIFVPPNFLVLWAAQRMDPGRLGILLMTEVLVGAISAALFSGETFGLRETIGTTLIVAAGFIEVLGRPA